MSDISDPPIGDSLIETDPRSEQRRDPFYLAKAWIVWILQALLPRVQSAPQVLISNKAYTNQNAAIAVTALPTGPLGAGVYECWYTARKTTIDGVNSSLTVTLGWTDDDGSAQALSGAAMVVDTTTSPQSGAIRVTIAANSSITFSTAYVSNTPGTMRYKLQFTVKRIGGV